MDKDTYRTCITIAHSMSGSGNIYLYFSLATLYGIYYGFHDYFNKNVNRKIQRMPQSQTAANPLHQEEEKNYKN